MATPIRVLPTAPDAGGVRLHGDVAEVTRFGAKAGVLFGWSFAGWAKDFEVQAERYRLDALMFRDKGQDVRLRLQVGPGYIECSGRIWTGFKADGKSHKAIVIKGGNAAWKRKPAVLAPRQTGNGRNT